MLFLQTKIQAYLCGVEPFCDLIGSQEALQRAKENVERNDFFSENLFYPEQIASMNFFSHHRYFVVVGLLEMVDETLAVMQHYLPQYFSGLTREKGANKPAT